MCRSQLQGGLEWGPAFATAIIARAAAVLRANAAKHEDLILKKVLKETIHGRLSGGDAAQFLLLLNDVYPGYALDSTTHLQALPLPLPPSPGPLLTPASIPRPDLYPCLHPQALPPPPS